ncbi:hypothetical protein HPP92_009690 [Vanilla planifolia]|uniref:Uncharacterized protein n=1 Tax=Vanilla planifolia TaxID=51239 RepID=A0A835RAI3_VANPL|nr:hypothetical protein HPP92_009690 [Vanilla planifolia]
MAKYADKLIKHLGISGRLTQLELCCYKLERSVGEFRADMIRDQSEADLRMKSLVKRIHEVHRSVQIIRDKQELYETHKELANLQVSPKESTHSANSQKSTEGFKASATPENEAHSNGNKLQSLPHEPVRHVLNQSISYHTHHQALNPKPEPHNPPQGALMLDLSAHPQFKQQLNAAPNQPAHQLPSFLSTINNGLSRLILNQRHTMFLWPICSRSNPVFWDRKDTLLIPACRLTMLSM